MNRVTHRLAYALDLASMSFTVAVVSGDQDVRRAAARAFSRAPLDWNVDLYEAPPESADVVVCGVDVPTAGDAVFDPAAPHDALERVREIRRARGNSRAVLVLGATGGCGATTVALHLAARWAPGCRYAEVAPGGGAVRRLGLPSDARPWFPGEDDLQSSALPVRGGFCVMVAPSPCPEAVHFPLRRAVEEPGKLVVDAGTSEAGGLLAAIGTAVLVLPPTRPGARRAAELLAGDPPARWAVVTNRTGPGGQLMRAALEEIVGRPIALELPCCAALRDAEDSGLLLEGSHRRWTRGIARLASALDALP